MKDEIVGAAIKEIVGLKPKKYSFLVDDSREDKKTKCVNKNIAATVNKNVVATISHGEYKYVSLNEKYFRHSMNRFQNSGHRIGTYKINISLSCFDDKIYILSNRYDGASLGY